METDETDHGSALRNPGAREAERLIALGVDRIGSVILSPETWKIPTVRDVVRLVRGSGAKSSLIPLLAREDDILRALDYYQPDFVHFCEWIPLDPEKCAQREAVCAEAIRLQRRVKREFPPLGITRSIPIPEPGLTDPALSGRPSWRSPARWSRTPMAS